MRLSLCSFGQLIGQQLTLKFPFIFFILFIFHFSQTAVIAQADENVAEVAFQYGRNIGLAFQLVDDMLDFVSSTEQMGKPTAADLKLGLATAPVLFACEKVSIVTHPIDD